MSVRRGLPAVLGLMIVVLLIGAPDGWAARAAILDGTLFFEGEPGEHNNVAIRLEGTVYRVTDSAVSHVESDGTCTPDGAAVLCDSALVGDISAALEDGNDRLTIDASVPAEVFGGPGTDVIFGGQAGDSLSGNLGTDTLNGRGGDDQLVEVDDERNVLDGGPGEDCINGGSGPDDISGGPGDDAAAVRGRRAGRDRRWRGQRRARRGNGADAARPERRRRPHRRQRRRSSQLRDSCRRR